MRTVTLSYPILPETAALWARPQVAALGQFDGLHRGHASVIASAVALARQEGIPASVMTFHPHPKDVMGKGDYDGYLTPPKDKQEILAGMGVDILYIIEFNEQLSKVSPEDFVSLMLLPLQIVTAVVGFDFRFGYLGKGDPERLQELGQGAMSVVTAPPFLIEGEKVSSSGIRKSLQNGEITLANTWFGRCYHLRGTVVHGEKRGRTIGFPTANVQLEDRYVIPAKGVYAVRVFYKDEVLHGVMNVGVKPTFHEGVTAPSFEVHVFDFAGDIYGQELELELVAFIRPERKFDSIGALIAQIGEDAETAKSLLEDQS
ncbi:bifunctional riboflavin kinase/FMN adenylyltransferase [Paenibacillus helianthi]|uniref:Riboflavin biosynthesis protein n=1 Tax=Paenibacillus helianthi TaxID=1349432 RepID=A0ABX3EMW1_9BACL|nr:MULTISPECIES: bifunctional riboflavin kinase/FAD synthetase [Paenibacillus]OKP83830.1 bifunctional riboflavin kinase/FMN adenylyltransferase [Paenibacillus sp. P32E]OKP86379.1 bifunctional riboflavin kinase/FMN adenylyltransferase [Paenibacillus helianthi]